MYEYAPKPAKRFEKRLTLLLLLSATLLFALSKIPVILFPGIFRLFAVILLIGAVMITTRSLMRNYIYRVEPSDQFADGGVYDFTVTEVCAKRATVVCRVSLNDIESMTPITRQNQRVIARKQKGERVYFYTAELFPQNAYLLTVRDGESFFYLRVIANDDLISAMHCL